MHAKWQAELLLRVDRTTSGAVLEKDRPREISCPGLSGARREGGKLLMSCRMPSKDVALVSALSLSVEWATMSVVAQAVDTRHGTLITMRGIAMRKERLTV